MKHHTKIAIIALMALSACAETAVQPMAQDTFKVATTAAPACGAAGARNVNFRAAAIEVIRRGYDKFVIVGDQTDMDGWTGTFSQGMIVRVIPERSSEVRNALSARATLGADWQAIVTEGVPLTCTS